MNTIVRANCTPTKRNEAGQVEEFVADMVECSNPWIVGTERRYELRGTLASGIADSADVPGASPAEMDAINRDLQFIENFGLEA